MKVLVVYARLYGDALQKALLSIRKSPWTLLLPMALLVAVALLGMLVGRLGLGLIGGFIMYLGTVALASGYLYFVSELVAQSKVSVNELKRSLTAYFGPLLSVGFVLWIARLILGLALQRVPNGAAIYQIVLILMAILLSAAPEVIYQRTPLGGIATIQSSVEFLQRNWLEWIVPNIPLFVAAYALIFLSFGGGLVGQLLTLAAAGALLHVAFVFRGFVFKALDRSNHRQRMFNYRNG